MKTVTVPVRWQEVAGRDKVFQKAVYALNQHPIYGAISTIAKICKSRNQGVGVALHTISPSDPLAKVLLPVPMTLCSAVLEVLVPKGGILLIGDTTVIPPIWML